MDTPKNLMLKLDFEAHIIQKNLLVYINKHISSKTQAMNAELTKKEEQWERERKLLQGQVAKLKVENAQLTNNVPSRRGKCGQCTKHKETITVLKEDLKQCQEDSQDQQDRLEEQVARKKTKLKEYVELLYTKDEETSSAGWRWHLSMGVKNL